MRVQRTRSSPSALRSPLTRHPLGGRARFVAIMLLGLAVSALAGQADTADSVLAALKARHFRPLSVDQVPSLFPEKKAVRLTSHGAPVELEWASAAEPCSLAFRAGSTAWGDQLAEVELACTAATREAASGLILDRVRIVSPAAVDHTAEYLKRGFSSLSLDWAGGAWAGSGASVSVSLKEQKASWQSSLSILFSMPTQHE